MEYKCEKCDGFCELNITGTCIGEEDQPPLRCPSANIDAEWVMVEDAPEPAGTITDGFGQTWGPCPVCQGKMEVVRPGKAQCPKCG